MFLYVGRGTAVDVMGTDRDIYRRANDKSISPSPKLASDLDQPFAHMDAPFATQQNYHARPGCLERGTYAPKCVVYFAHNLPLFHPFQQLDCVQKATGSRRGDHLVQIAVAEQVVRHRHPLRGAANALQMVQYVQNALGIACHIVGGGPAAARRFGIERGNSQVGRQRDGAPGRQWQGVAPEHRRAECLCCGKRAFAHLAVIVDIADECGDIGIGAAAVEIDQQVGLADEPLADPVGDALGNGSDRITGKDAGQIQIVDGAGALTGLEGGDIAQGGHDERAAQFVGRKPVKYPGDRLHPLILVAVDARQDEERGARFVAGDRQIGQSPRTAVGSGRDGKMADLFAAPRDLMGEKFFNRIVDV